MSDALSKKQEEFIKYSVKKWNIAHGPVRSGKTVGTLIRFLEACYRCPDSQIYMFGYSMSSIFENCIKLLLETDQFRVFKPFCTWSPGKGELHFSGKTITLIGAKDEGAVGRIMGKTISIAYCDEMRLYPDNVIQAIISRLSQTWSQAFITTNPSHPNHIIKKWIDEAEEGHSSYYALQFMLDDNPFLTESYKEELRKNLSGLFYKRNYLGLWCLAEGAIFDFWERNLYVINKAPEACEYWVAGIDFGMSNPTSCVVLGVQSGRLTQRGNICWVEDEYYWDIKQKGRQKLVGELAKDIFNFLEPYGVRAVYIDPSAAALRAELNRMGIHTTDANNDVEEGIQIMTSMVRDGKCLVFDRCMNLIREIEAYSWDSKAAERGEDRPIKKDDHAIDALRYILASHKIPKYNPYKSESDPTNYIQKRFDPGYRKFGV